MNIRQAKSDDATEIAKIHIDSWRTAYKGIVPDSQLSKFNYIQHSERFRQSLESDSEETYVAENDMQLIGFLTIGPCRDNDIDQNTTGEIWGIYLDPIYWRRGIGRSLCEWAENTLSTRGYKQIALWVFADNIQSRKFYETIGYSPDGFSKILTIGKPLKAVRYLKTFKCAEQIV
jgi:ribosomal protein S18 acetylase RimI-like enzyme